ncbi:MAG: 50S ribosomal protein L11 methyltransferase [bacterium]|nr:50S ribosomal protein L11 methyltransferase [bacterium]
MTLRGYQLAGPDLRAALDWLYVHADVTGVVEAEDAGSATVYLAAPLPELPFPDLEVREVVVETTTQTGLEDDRAIVVAKDLLVRPPWVERPTDFEGIELIVPRGNAFGSGEHDSTQAALVVLHELWHAQGNGLADGPTSCADVGTGSGILLLYAATRGVTELQGCDIDPAAVKAAAELLPRATIREGGAARLSPADCVIANMTGTELQSELSAILALWRGGGPLVLSGMRTTEVDPIAAAVPHRVTRRVVRGAFTALGYASDPAVR